MKVCMKNRNTIPRHRSKRGTTLGYIRGRGHCDSYKWIIGEYNQVGEWRHSITSIPSKKIEELTLNEECDAEDNFVDVKTLQMPDKTKVDFESNDNDWEKPEKMASYFEKEDKNDLDDRAHSINKNRVRKIKDMRKPAETHQKKDNPRVIKWAMVIIHNSICHMP
eukprot:Gb_28532 [translate_table: standard]